MIKLVSLFSGIGAFEKALTNLNVPYKTMAYSEIDKYASTAYSYIHNMSTEKNLGDITKINENDIPDCDLITYGFPCQDISAAGHKRGLSDKNGSKTRSGLLFDALKIINTKQPKIAIAENVKNFVNKKFKDDFDIVLHSLKEFGYNNYYKILNAKDYGVPQNRERIFIISIRKDIDNFKFKFPETIISDLGLKDFLESTVDEKYYIDINKTKLSTDVIIPTIVASRSRTFNNLTQQQLEINPRGVTNSLTTVQKDNLLIDPRYNRLRNLTPKEYWRLMGFTDDDYELAKQGLEKTFYKGKNRSNTQMYKMAGNSIVVTVLREIFKNIFKSNLL